MAQAPQQHHQQQSPQQQQHATPYPTQTSHEHWLYGGQYQPYPEHDPYQTPRLAGQIAQEPTPPALDAPGAPGAIGQKAKSTTPMMRRMLSEDTYWPTRELCPICEGRGKLLSILTHQCSACGRWWTREQVQDRGRRSFREIILPCGHAVRTHKIEFIHPECSNCLDSPRWVGRGYILRWATVRELFDLMQLIFQIPDETMGELRAVQTVHAVQAVPFHGATSEPSAPTPHLPPLSPHLPPLAPDRPERSTGH